MRHAWESIFESCGARCQITNKVNKERDKRKHRSQEKKLLKQIDVYGSLLKESDTSLWLDKIKFSNEPKLTELAKQNMVSTRYTATDVWPLTSQSTALLYFFLNKCFYRTQHIMPYRNNSVKQNRLEDQN